MPEPLAAPSGLAGRLSRQGAAAIAAALDHLLEQNEWARRRLADHVGRVVLIGIEVPAPLAVQAGTASPGLRFPVRIDPGVRLVPAAADAHADVTMSFRPSVDALFGFASGGMRELYRHLTIEGDAMLATELGELARHLRWDPAEDLSRFTGDIAAQRLVGTIRNLASALQDAGERMSSNASRFLSVETAQLVDRSSLDTFSAAMGELERRVDAVGVQLRRR
jgi:ubiquinone biosynthesis protein UbiJ